MTSGAAEHCASVREKASLTSGTRYWHTTASESLGLEGMQMSDGRNGLRREANSAVDSMTWRCVLRDSVLSRNQPNAP